MFKLHTIISLFFYIINSALLSGQPKLWLHKAYLPDWQLWEKMNMDPYN